MILLNLSCVRSHFLKVAGKVLFLFPLDIGSVHASRSNDSLFTVIIWVLVESDSRDMLRMSRDSTTVLLDLGAWELINADTSKVITRGNSGPVSVTIYSINVSAICTSWEDTHDFPSKFTCRCFPNGWITQTWRAIFDMNILNAIIVQLQVGLVNGLQESWISTPIKSGDGWWMHVLDLPVKGVVAVSIDLVDIDSIIVPTNCEELVIWRVFHCFAPFSRVL